jgi:hypothetical protein
MPSVAQKCVPTDARKLAQAGDGRALLAIPDARRDVPRLIAGRPMSRYDDHIPAAQLGSRKAVAGDQAPRE